MTTQPDTLETETPNGPKAPQTAALLAGASALLSACGGGGDAAAPSDAVQVASDRMRPLAVLTSAPPTALTPAQKDAWRFLTSASFGPTPSLIAEVTKNAQDARQAWVSNQYLAGSDPTVSTVTLLKAKLPLYQAQAATEGRSMNSLDWVNACNSAIWQAFITGKDQLRQRVAYALSQMMVVSFNSDAVSERVATVASYHDMLVDQGMGGYRTLIESVCKHPAMGYYLSHLRNPAPTTASIPDQNFARELLQLFSIGKDQLDSSGNVVKNPDGSVKPAYTQTDIEILSYVFTGWGLANVPWNSDSRNEFPAAGAGFSFSDFEDQVAPMQPWDSTTVGQKTLKSGSYAQPDTKWNEHATLDQFKAKFKASALTSPAGWGVDFLGKKLVPTGTCQGDLKAALDIIATHVNVPFFMARQMIQRLVTSNPSAKYVADVAIGSRTTQGGIAMSVLVMKTLTHPEAVSIPLAQASYFGKVREPVLRITAAARALPVVWNRFLVDRTDGLLNEGFPPSTLGQCPYLAPSVFNFYRPGFVLPGSKTAASQKVAPELQLCGEAGVAAYVRAVHASLTMGFGARQVRKSLVAYGSSGFRQFAQDTQIGTLELNFTDEFAAFNSTANGGITGVIRSLNDKLLGGRMSQGLYTHIQQAIDKLDVTDAIKRMSADERALFKVRIVVFLIMTAPEFIVQR